MLLTVFVDAKVFGEMAKFDHLSVLSPFRQKRMKLRLRLAYVGLKVFVGLNPNEGNIECTGEDFFG